MIGFVGLSHLGIIYSLATAAKGFEVVGFDSDARLCQDLSSGRFPITEPGLPELFETHRGSIRFCSDSASLANCSLVFFALDIPTDSNNRSDLGPLSGLIKEVAPRVRPDCLAVVLCQVPPGFTRSLNSMRSGEKGSVQSKFFYQVETLVFGNAIDRALHPERLIVGCENPDSPLPKVYADWLAAYDCPIHRLRYESAELAKISINLFLAASVSTTNMLAEICEQIGADWSEIVPTLRSDRRIGPHAYLTPGLGISGGNLERDLVSAQRLGEEHGTDVGLVAAIQSNSRHQGDWVLRQLHQRVFATDPDAIVAIWGLAYKPNTRSLKNSPAMRLIESLPNCRKHAFDPQVTRVGTGVANLVIAPSALAAAKQSDVLVIMTPWPEFSRIGLVSLREAMSGRLIIDPFGALNSIVGVEKQFRYLRLGAPPENA